MSIARNRPRTPDPAGLDAVDLTNPQSLNRYAYAMNNPTTLTDPSGLFSDAHGSCQGNDWITDAECAGPGGGGWDIGFGVHFGGGGAGGGGTTSGGQTGGAGIFGGIGPDGIGSGVACSPVITIDGLCFPFVLPGVPVSVITRQVGGSVPSPGSGPWLLGAIGGAVGTIAAANNAVTIPKICGGTFGFGGLETDAVEAGAFSGGIVENDFENGISGGSLVEAWQGGEGPVAGVGKITSPSDTSVLQGFWGFVGGGINAGPLAGAQVGYVGGNGWGGLYIEGHAGIWAVGAGGYLRSCGEGQ